MDQDNRVLCRNGARELTEREGNHISGGSAYPYTLHRRFVWPKGRKCAHWRVRLLTASTLPGRSWVTLLKELGPASTDPINERRKHE
jgi:hypothetical protein